MNLEARALEVSRNLRVLPRFPDRLGKVRLAIDKDKPPLFREAVGRRVL